MIKKDTIHRWITFIAILCAVTMIHIAHASSFNILSRMNLERPSENWVVLVAGSNGYYNYRHQADICHAYKIVTEKGKIPKSNVITFMFDDIAYSKENPHPGVIINEYNGTNVYIGKEAIDYRANDVTPQNFLSVLRGEKMSVGSGKTLNSGPNDKVFIYFSDHGATNVLAFPGFSLLHASDLFETLQFMYQNKRYQQLVFYVEACESGSMFNQILPSSLNIYAETASTPFESSYACDYSNEFSAYLNDCYSINWMNDSDISDIREETVGVQFEKVRRETTTSRVCRYGDFVIEKEPLINFQGNNSIKSMMKQWSSEENRKNAFARIFNQENGAKDVTRQPIDSRKVYEDYLQRRLRTLMSSSTASLSEKLHILTLIEQYRESMKKSDRIFNFLSDQYQLEKILNLRKAMLNRELDPDSACRTQSSLLAHPQCVKQLIQLFEKRCGSFDEYSLRYISYLGDLCVKQMSTPSEKHQEMIHSLDETLIRLCR